MVKTPEKTLEKAVAQYNRDRTNPEAVYNFYEAFWDNFRANLVRSGMSLAKSDLRTVGFTDEELKSVWVQRARSGEIGKADLSGLPIQIARGTLVDRIRQDVPDMPLYLPEVLANQYGLQILVKGFPGMRSWLFRNSDGVINTCVLADKPELAGWMFIESSLTPPYNNMILKDVRKTFEARGRFGQTASIYMAGSVVSKVVEDHYFDEGPYERTRLLGTAVWGTWSSGDGFSSVSSYRSGLAVGHLGDGLTTGWVEEDTRSSLIGFRSAEPMLKAV